MTTFSSNDPVVLYISKESGITAEEWEALVLATPGLRLNRETEYVEDRVDPPVTVTSSGLTAEIELPYADNVWVRSGETHFWINCFHYSKEKCAVSFPFLPNFDNPENQIRKMAALLASKLEAKITDDSGKVYEW